MLLLLSHEEIPGNRLCGNVYGTFRAKNGNYREPRYMKLGKLPLYLNSKYLNSGHEQLRYAMILIEEPSYGESSSLCSMTEHSQTHSSKGGGIITTTLQPTSV